MNPDNELNSIRAAWQHLQPPTSAEAEARARSSARADRARARLRSTYLRSAAWAVLVMLLAPELYLIVDMPIWFCVVYCAFGAMMMVLTLRLASVLNRADYLSCPVLEAQAHLADVVRLRRRIETIGWLAGASLIATFLYILWAMGETEAFWGGCAGGIVGIAVAIRKIHRQNRLLRQMEQELRGLAN